MNVSSTWITGKCSGGIALAAEPRANARRPVSFFKSRAESQLPNEPPLVRTRLKGSIFTA